MLTKEISKFEKILNGVIYDTTWSFVRCDPCGMRRWLESNGSSSANSSSKMSQLHPAAEPHPSTWGPLGNVAPFGTGGVAKMWGSVEPCSAGKDFNYCFPFSPDKLPIWCQMTPPGLSWHVVKRWCQMTLSGLSWHVVKVMSFMTPPDLLWHVVEMVSFMIPSGLLKNATKPVSQIKGQTSLSDMFRVRQLSSEYSVSVRQNLLLRFPQTRRDCSKFRRMTVTRRDHHLQWPLDIWFLLPLFA
ncbi:hypothetical protein ACFE04_021573 [Oxalis oulophora]